MRDGDKASSTTIAARVVDLEGLPRIHVMGPTIQFVTSPDEDAPCLMRGVIPPGAVVPLHSHADPETFVVLSGWVEGLHHHDGTFEWKLIGAGEVFHVRGHAKHAFRNQSEVPAVMLITSTPTMGRFFREIGTPLASGEHVEDPPSDATIQRFLEASAKYGYWNATAEENRQVGLTLPLP